MIRISRELRSRAGARAPSTDIEHREADLIRQLDQIKRRAGTTEFQWEASVTCEEHYKDKNKEAIGIELADAFRHLIGYQLEQPAEARLADRSDTQ